MDRLEHRLGRRRVRPEARAARRIGGGPVRARGVAGCGVRAAVHGLATAGAAPPAFCAGFAGDRLSGALLTLVGSAFALWARVSLGRDWSSAIEIKQDHILAQRGPYAVVRHPIYTGILLAMLGTALAVGTLRGLAAVGLALIAFLQRANVEEAFLTQQFGARYAEYKREVKKIIPLVW